MSDTLMQRLAELATAEPDAARAARVRARCRTRLARRAPRRPGSSSALATIWKPAIAILGVAYLIGAIVEATRIYGLL
jgi:hypothetical protein